MAEADAVEELVERYLQAWTERRAPARRRLLEGLWAEGGTYSSWVTSLEGLDALDDHIARRQQEQEPGSRVVRTSDVHANEGRISFTWVLFGPDGTAAFEGSEFAEVDEHGKIVRVTSFSGRPAPQP
jgi:SnoaL-like protein